MALKSPGLREGVLILCIVIAELRASGQTLFYATSSAMQTSNSVEYVTTAGADNTSLFTATGSSGDQVSRCTAIAVDPNLQKVFLADADNQALWSMNLNGTGLSLLQSGLTGTPTDLALDTVHQRIYYTTSSATQGYNTIQRMDYTGNNHLVLFTAGQGGNPAARCTALALDLKNALIIFSDAGINGLWSLNLQGGNLALIQSNLLAVPLDLALDVTNQLIYFATSSCNQSGNTVQSLSYPRGAGTLLFTATGSGGNGVGRCTAVEFDPAHSQLYLADAGMNALWSLNTNGAGLSQIATNLPASLRRFRFLSLPILVANGGFETGNFSGWISSGNFSDCYVSAGSTYVHSGHYGAELGPVSSLGYLSQMLATTAGAAYSLSFWLNSPDGAVPNEFLVSWNGATLLDQTNIAVIGWINLQFTVTATGSSTVLQFGFRNDPSFFGLDDISVVPVVLPPSPNLIGISLTGNQLVLNGINGVSGETYHIISSTNLALPVNQWTPIIANAWSTNGNFSVPIANDVNGSDPTEFYLLQTP